MPGPGESKEEPGGAVAVPLSAQRQAPTPYVDAEAVLPALRELVFAARHVIPISARPRHEHMLPMGKDTRRTVQGKRPATSVTEALEQLLYAYPLTKQCFASAVVKSVIMRKDPRVHDNPAFEEFVVCRDDACTQPIRSWLIMHVPCVANGNQMDSWWRYRLPLDALREPWAWPLVLAMLHYSRKPKRYELGSDALDTLNALCIPKRLVMPESAQRLALTMRIAEDFGGSVVDTTIGINLSMTYDKMMRAHWRIVFPPRPPAIAQSSSPKPFALATPATAGAFSASASGSVSSHVSVGLAVGSAAGPARPAGSAAVSVGSASLASTATATPVEAAAAAAAAVLEQSVHVLGVKRRRDALGCCEACRMHAAETLAPSPPVLPAPLAESASAASHKTSGSTTGRNMRAATGVLADVAEHADIVGELPESGERRQQLEAFDALAKALYTVAADAMRVQKTLDAAKTRVLAAYEKQKCVQCARRAWAEVRKSTASAWTFALQFD